MTSDSKVTSLNARRLGVDVTSPTLNRMVDDALAYMKSDTHTQMLSFRAIWSGSCWRYRLIPDSRTNPESVRKHKVSREAFLKYSSMVSQDGLTLIGYVFRDGQINRLDGNRIFGADDD